MEKTEKKQQLFNVERGNVTILEIPTDNTGEVFSSVFVSSYGY